MRTQMRQPRKMAPKEGTVSQPSQNVSHSFEASCTHQRHTSWASCSFMMFPKANAVPLWIFAQGAWSTASTAAVRLYAGTCTSTSSCLTAM